MHHPAGPFSLIRSLGVQAWRELAAVAGGYFDDRVPRMAAALSYYTVFSLAPLLVIVLAVAGLAFGEQAARGQISAQFHSLVGEAGGQAIQTMIENAHRPEASSFAAIVGLITLLIGAMGVFGELQDSLNTIWKVRLKPGRTLRGFVRTRLLSFAMVFGIGFLLLASLVLSAVLSAITGSLHVSSHSGWLAPFIDLAVSFVIVGLLFAGSFKFLPDVRIRWRDVWTGAVVTSFLFALGKYAIGLYLGKSAIATSYGSMGSLAVLLIWIYFSSQIFLIGALFTRVHALAHDSPVAPKADAEWLPAVAPGPAPPAAS